MSYKQLENAMSISKVLSANDTGETGGHQAGMLIPKTGGVLSFFPLLEKDEKNPRASLKFIDSSNDEWKFMFIYYNNKFFNGTRNEFRLTGMTKFIRQNNLKAGDKIILSCERDGTRTIKHERAKTEETKNVLKLGSSWKVVKI
ncbi:Restriction endonuclease EcoRII, N-terminal [Terribacillus halophilus]|uniref:Restriction endonuclease EcoRII, N-terminal n=1 Tax=Terribacillus halophilus TaxID=361279 RepID=A0A1G6L4J9_9BACI|nr:EcoRII N-terminal effector-binding domain-containing protein [Terribacillus halophilus]SDC38144.1 Restriction endonuclease EcoRII, N-terminal [Terribacillus halophilus]